MSRECAYAFLHGGMQGGWVWDETLTALAQQTSNSFGEAYVLDVPGCGSKRGRATEQMDLAEVAGELLAELVSAGLREIILTGHSQAGTVLPLMLQMKPHLFRRAIYVSCIAPPAGQTVMDFGRDSLKFSSREISEPNWQARFCNDMTATAARSFMDKLGKDAWPTRAYAATSWAYEHLGAVPATYVACLQDATVPLAVQYACAERLRAGRLVRIDAGHQVMNVRPHALAEALRYEAEIDG